jgi:hypothetical protein
LRFVTEVAMQMLPLFKIPVEIKIVLFLWH